MHTYLNSSYICVCSYIHDIPTVFKLVVPKRLTERSGQLMNINH